MMLLLKLLLNPLNLLNLLNLLNPLNLLNLLNLMNLLNPLNLLKLLNLLNLLNPLNLLNLLNPLNLPLKLLSRKTLLKQDVLLRSMTTLPKNLPITLQLLPLSTLLQYASTNNVVNNSYILYFENIRLSKQ